MENINNLIRRNDKQFTTFDYKVNINVADMIFAKQRTKTRKILNLNDVLISRHVIWLKVERSNNDPTVVGNLFRNAIMEVHGCPGDRKYNHLIGPVRFLRRNGTDYHAGLRAHRYGSSHSNQRIET